MCCLKKAKTPSLTAVQKTTAAHMLRSYSRMQKCCLKEMEKIGQVARCLPIILVTHRDCMCILTQYDSCFLCAVPTYYSSTLKGALNSLENFLLPTLELNAPKARFSSTNTGRRLNTFNAVQQ